MRRNLRPPEAATPGGLETSTITVAQGFFVYPKQVRVLSQLFEACLSCGRRLRLIGATITVRDICGHVAVCKVCRGCVIERGLIG